MPGKAPKRKDMRLRGYDYSRRGAYFITICVKGKEDLLGEITVGARIARPSFSSARPPFSPARPELPSSPNSEGESVELSDIGTLADIAIQNINRVYDCVYVDKYVIMPNHIHLILILFGSGERRGRLGGADEGTKAFKEYAGRAGEYAGRAEEYAGRAMRAPTISVVINQFKGYVTKQLGCSIWQKLFYDHIIRDEADYRRIWRYIDENPRKWPLDCYYES